MPITEGTETAAAGIDANSVANAFVNSLKASGLIVTPAAQVSNSQPDPFQSVLSELAANAEGGEASFQGVRKLFEGFEKRLEAKLNAQHKQMADENTIATRNAEALNHIYNAVDKYIGEDEGLKGFRESIKDSIVRELTTNRAHEGAMSTFYQTGVFSHELNNKLALNEVNKMNKFRGIDKAAKGPTGMNKQEGAGAGKLPAGGEEGDSLSEDPNDLTGRERDLFNAKLATAQRAGMRHDSKEAKEFALRGVRKFREGKQKAVEKMGSRRYHKD